MPRSRNGTDDPKNISFIGHKEHQAYHIVFGNELPPVQAEILNDKYIATEIWTMFAIPTEHAEAVHQLLRQLSRK